MTRLLNHVEYLLNEHDCIVLPGFGGFVQNEVNAKIKANKIYPPMKEISFNERLIFNDGILIQSYQESLHKSYEDALIELKKDILEFQNKLSRDGSVVFGRIGRFEINERIEFYPSSENLFGPKFFGLESFELEEIESDNDSNKIKDPYIYIKLRKVSFVNWLSLVAACLFLFFMAQPVEDVDNSLQEAFIAEKYLIGDLNSTTKSNITASTFKEKEIQSNITNDSVDYDNKETIQNDIIEEDKYYIILGSFTKISSAVSHIQNFKNNKYFKNAKILDYGNRYRVYSYSSSNKEEIFNELKNIRNSSKKMSSAWIFSK